MPLAAISLGSNLARIGAAEAGLPEANLREAITRLADVGHVAAVSSFHVTDPVGYLDQPRFTNAALLLETTLAPLELLRGLLAIEQAMGRDRTHTPPKGPRVIDLDLLLYDDVVMHTPELTLPHSAMHERRFVLAPLAEIAPAMRHPVLQRTMAELRREID